MADELEGGGQTPPGSPEPFNYDKWMESVPEEAKQKFAEQLWNGYNQQLSELYGDVLPTIADAKDDQELREFLAEVGKDKELRRFVTGPARQAYKTTLQGAGAGDTPAAPVEPELRRELDALKGEVEKDRSARTLEQYQTKRQQEFAALANEFPEFRFQKADASDPAYRRAEVLINYAEKNSSLDKPYAYRQALEELRVLENKEPPPAAPATTHATEPRQSPQAPRNPVEGRDRALQTLKRSGGIAGLAKTIKGNSR